MPLLRYSRGVHASEGADCVGPRELGSALAQAAQVLRGATQRSLARLGAETLLGQGSFLLCTQGQGRCDLEVIGPLSTGPMCGGRKPFL